MSGPRAMVGPLLSMALCDLFDWWAHPVDDLVCVSVVQCGLSGQNYPEETIPKGDQPRGVLVAGSVIGVDVDITGDDAFCKRWCTFQNIGKDVEKPIIYSRRRRWTTDDNEDERQGSDTNEEWQQLEWFILLQGWQCWQSYRPEKRRRYHVCIEYWMRHQQNGFALAQKPGNPAVWTRRHSLNPPSHVSSWLQRIYQLTVLASQSVLDLLI